MINLITHKCRSFLSGTAFFCHAAFPQVGLGIKTICPFCQSSILYSPDSYNSDVLLPGDCLVFQQPFCITSCSITNDSHFCLSNRQMGVRHLRPHGRTCKQAEFQLNPTRTPPVYGDIYLIVFISHLCISLCLQLF